MMILNLRLLYFLFNARLKLENNKMVSNTLPFLSDNYWKLARKSLRYVLNWTKLCTNGLFQLTLLPGFARVLTLFFIVNFLNFLNLPLSQLLPLPLFNITTVGRHNYSPTGLWKLEAIGTWDSCALKCSQHTIMYWVLWTSDLSTRKFYC